MRKSLWPLLLMLTITLGTAPVALQAQDVDDPDDPVVDVDVNPDNEDVDLNDEGAISRTSMGARAGFGLEPDQFAFGVQAIFGTLFNSESDFLSSLQFAPSVDVGLGSDLTVFSLNPDLRANLFSFPESRMNFYGKLGPTLAFVDPSVGDASTEIGLSLAAGLTMPMTGRNNYNLEARFGLGDVPDFRLLFGVQFGINPGGAGSAGVTR